MMQAYDGRCIANVRYIVINGSPAISTTVDVGTFQNFSDSIEELII